jgi:hypothetical protein
MTFEDYWKRLTAATPGLTRHDNSMRISVLSFKIAVSKAYRQGRDDELEELRQRSGVDDNATLDFLNGIWGKR